MVATILFFCFSIRAEIEALNLEPQVETAVIEKLISAIYLQHASEKAKSAEIRHRLAKLSEDILSSLRDKSSPFAELKQP